MSRSPFPYRPMTGHIAHLPGKKPPPTIGETMSALKALGLPDVFSSLSTEPDISVKPGWKLVRDWDTLAEQVNEMWQEHNA